MRSAAQVLRALTCAFVLILLSVICCTTAASTLRFSAGFTMGKRPRASSALGVSDSNPTSVGNNTAGTKDAALHAQHMREQKALNKQRRQLGRRPPPGGRSAQGAPPPTGPLPDDAVVIDMPAEVSDVWSWSARKQRTGPATRAAQTFFCASSMLMASLVGPSAADPSAFQPAVTITVRGSSVGR